MSNQSVDYTGENTPTQGLVTTPLQAATQIMQGYIPANLLDMGTNDYFRDVVLGYVLRDTTDQDTVLNVLCSALRGAPDTVRARKYAEYVAAVAFSWGHKELALKALMRNRPEETTSFLWSVAQAMNKQMPGPFYQTLLVSQLPQAEMKWEETK